VFVTEITKELILGLEVLRTCDLSVDVGRDIPGLERE
jgi:hypothetical protein